VRRVGSGRVGPSFLKVARQKPGIVDAEDVDIPGTRLFGFETELGRPMQIRRREKPTAATTELAGSETCGHGVKDGRLGKSVQPDHQVQKGCES
jgi:hypothetical protein